MDPQAEIVALIARSKDPAKLSDPGRQQRVELYGEGLNSRITQIGYTYRFIKELGRRFPNPPDAFGYSDQHKIHFYSDSFWAFGRSSLDILGQLINQTHNLGIDERRCDFTSAVAQMNTSHASDPLTTQLNGIKSSSTYKELDAYRNCSMHRRQVYLEGRKTETHSATAGYSGFTGPFTEYRWILVDDPLVVIPTTARQLELVDYCGTTLTFIHTNIENIVKALLS